MLVSGLTRAAFSTLGAVASSRLSILIFHRVHAKADSLFPHEPDAIRFERLMRFVTRSFRVMALGRAASCLADGSLPTRSLVITFDDGYADNAEVALPILQRLGLVATFFVSTGFLDGGRMWNDTVIECIRACRKQDVDLEAFGLGRCSLAGPTQRVETIEKLLNRIKYMTLAERENALAQLQRQVGGMDLPADLMLRSDQVRALHLAGMEIGAHTVRHPILTTLSRQEAESEISEGRRHLEGLIDAPVDVMAYPNGKPGRDYDYSHVELVRDQHFRAAVSTAPGVATIGDDLFQLPRFTPWGSRLTTWTGRLLLNQRNTDFDRVRP